MRPTPPALLVVLVLSACGRRSPGDGAAAGAAGAAAAKPAIDRSSPEAVLVAAHRALSTGDLDGLSPLLTESGLLHVKRDLEAWRVLLVDPIGGPRSAARVPIPDDPVERAAMERALRGSDPAALLRVYVRAVPTEPLPPLEPVAREATVLRAERSVPARDGAIRLVRFLRGPDGWRIDRLPL